MSKKTCFDCVHYAAPETEHTCGKCTYPVPGWLRLVATGGFISTGGIEAQDCDLHVTRKAAAEAALQAGEGEA